MGDTVFLIPDSDDDNESTQESEPDMNNSMDAEESTSQPSRRVRHLSIENTTLTEIITIYEKLKKGRENRVLMKSKFDFKPKQVDMTFKEAAETLPMVPTFNIGSEKSIISTLDFNKFKNFRHSKYLYYSEKTCLIQSDFIENLGQSVSELLKEKNYWLNIFDPDEEDYSILFNSYGVHDLTISDIREINTEEKLEVFEHYTFVSMRLISENKDKKNEEENEDDVDFNILLFRDFVVTIHSKQWPSVNDILGFLNLMSNNSRTPLSPDWVFFSIFVEMNQDAKYIMNSIEPKIDRIKVGNKSVEIMKRNFDLELEVYAISRFIKPKMRILRQLKQKCSKRFNKSVLRLLGDILQELGEQLNDLKQFNVILERSQDTFLALVTSDHSREANEVNRIMKRISEIALFFLPFNLISLYMGTNVEIPFQNSYYTSEIAFYIMFLISTILGTSLYMLRKYVFFY